MASPARTQRGGGGGDLSPTVVKGVVLIVVAVLLGAFLLFRGVDSGSDATLSDGATGQAADGADDTADDPTATTVVGGQATTPVETTTTVADAARPPAEVTVLVANASGVPGAAAKISEDLGAEGFVTPEEANAPEPAETTVVYFVGNDEAEAKAVASALGLDPEGEGIVGAMPDPPPVTDLRGATVLVILGPDKAPTA